MNYEVFVHADLLLGVVPRSGLQRRLIFEFLGSLKRQPDQSGDFVEKDATLLLEMKTIRLTKHANGYLEMRGFTFEEVQSAIREAQWGPATNG